MHHFLGSPDVGQQGVTRILVAGWPSDAYSARVGASVVTLWRSQVGKKASPLRGESGSVQLLEGQRVCRSVASCLNNPADCQTEVLTDSDLVLGHFGFPDQAQVEASEAAMTLGSNLLLPPTAWPVLIWAVSSAQAMCRVAAASAGRVAKLAGCDHMTVVLVQDPDKSTGTQASLVRKCDGLYGTVAEAVGMTWKVLSLAVGPTGKMPSPAPNDLIAQLERAKLLR